jgi:hypothetical protein
MEGVKAMNLGPRLVLSMALTLPISGALSAQGLLVTELMANNTRTLADEDGDFPDWVEIFNAGEAEVSLEGYSLTDDGADLARWKFPAVMLAPGRFLIVFCSGKDRRDPASQLHANFRLEERGESMGLVAHDGRTVLSAIDFPEQQADISYGISTDSMRSIVVPAAAPVRALVPPSGDLELSWTQADFDDSAWRQGITAVGFGVAPPEADVIGLDIGSDMRGVNSSVYLRIPFYIADTGAVDVMRLRLRYDDGFATYLNGRLVAAGNTPPALAWNSTATGGHSPQGWELFDISTHADVLRPGENLLAIQALNVTAVNSDLFIQPQVETVEVGWVRPGVFLYFERPSPGTPNPEGFAEVAPRPQVSLAAGTYVGTQTIEITTALVGGVIRYTLDGTLPHEGSTAYSGPIQITGPTRLAARVFKDGLLASQPERRTFVIVAPSLVDFSSNLPLVLCVTFDKALGPNCGGGDYTPGHISVVAPGNDGRANLVEEPHIAHPAAFRRRGTSTCGNAKFSFNVEIQDADGGEEDVEILDFPAESDYVMHAPAHIDRALIRNPIAYWMSREIGHWAPRTRNVECFFHAGTGPMTSASYAGVYNIMERNDRHPMRIDIQEMTSRDTEGSAITGGYILRRDSLGPNEIRIHGGGHSNIIFVYPTSPLAAQQSYIASFLDQAILSLSPNIGMQEDNTLIDFASWIDYHILNLYMKNSDAFRLSTYFYKDREGPLVMGPLWDFDHSMGWADDGRAADPLGWDSSYFNGAGGNWYSILFQDSPPIGDSPWHQAYRARWRELRQGPLRTERILAQIDLYATELNEAATRDAARWPELRGRFGGFQGEIDHLKSWLTRRADWIDSQLVEEKPVFSHRGGIVERNLQVEIFVTTQATIHYTLDGSDPRGPNSRPAPGAILYAGPITIDRNTWILARAWSPEGLWSDSSEARFVVDVPRLMITEVMYHPLPPTPEEDPAGELNNAGRMEFVEIANVGTEPVPLGGMRFTKGITYTFPESAGSIEPGEVLVIPSNLGAFAARYGSRGIRVAGPFSGALSDSGEAIALTGSFGEPIFDFSYSSAWHPGTAGEGYSLVNSEPTAAAAGLGSAARWRPSTTIHGDPGRAELDPGSDGRLPGDATGDGKLGISDALRTLHLLAGGSADWPCKNGGIEAPGNALLLDWDGSGTVNVADAVASLRYLFLSGEAHAAGTACIAVQGCIGTCGE